MFVSLPYSFLFHEILEHIIVLKSKNRKLLIFRDEYKNIFLTAYND